MLISVCFFIAAFEGLLVFGIMNNLSIHWIPPAYKATHDQIHKPSADRALSHPFLFNGPINALEKSDNFNSRIIVLGDSYVWGKGLPYEQGWTRKFQRRINEFAPGVEVVEWAKNGWSTHTQFKFLENLYQNHEKFKADFLLVAFVINDLDLGQHDRSKFRKKIDWKTSSFRHFRKVIPNTFDFITAHISAATEVLTNDHGYKNWVGHLWSDKNVADYRKLLLRLKTFLDKAKIPFAFALTPGNPNAEYYEHRFNLIGSMLEELKIPYVDLFPRVAKAFPDGDYGQGYRKLWANPADSHPGNEVTTVLAEGILEYLQDQGLLSRLVKKQMVRIADRLDAIPACGSDTQMILRVGLFDHFELAKGQPFYRIQGIGIENAAPELKSPKAVYILVGDKHYPALPRLPLKVIFPNSKKHTLRGWFAVDIPVSHVKDPALREITIVSTQGCKVIKHFEQPLRPRNRIPPTLLEPPEIRLNTLLSRGQ